MFGILWFSFCFCGQLFWGFEVQFFWSLVFLGVRFFRGLGVWGCLAFGFVFVRSASAAQSNV